ncbi:MAG: DegT/DnrJ/EryC1/StrS family aminotransferase [Hydrogenophilaceae bacterium]|nr:DegT/DnrJ/EryC1/StrS family aminotransferase [Hydrogenophilaceae bacterium]
MITAEDRAAVDAVLASGWIAQGPAVAALEADFVRRYGGGGACALSSGSAALFLALKSLGAGEGATVAVPSYACSALLNAVYLAGATPKVVDVLPDSFCLDPAALARQAAEAAFAIAVHTYGAPADVAALQAPGRQLIEDCCQSLGGVGVQGQLGSQGEAAVFSFYATKIVTGGQGGLVWSKAADVAEAVRYYRQFDCRESYVPRFNLQMTDIQAALVNSQLARLEAIRSRRQAIARSYLAALPAGLSVQSGLADAGRMAYRFVVLAPDLATREALRRHMEQAGVGCAVPIERYELLHRYLKLDPADFPVAERLADTSLSLPIHPGLSDAQLAQAAAALSGFRP